MEVVGYGEYGRHYFSPSEDLLDYYKSKGMTVFRLPIRWERAQRSLYEELNAEYIGYIDDVADAAAARGLKIILHPQQNFIGNDPASYYDIPSATYLMMGTADLPYDAFADFWRKMAEHYRGHRGIYGYFLINEPHRMDIDGMDGKENWKQAAQAAINAIREVDPETPILVPGYAWSNATYWPWASDILKDLVDPSNNMIYVAHEYLDDDHSGHYYSDCSTVPLTRGPERIATFVDWLRANGKKGMIGELGTPSDPCWLGVLEPTLAYIAASADVLTSFQWWYSCDWGAGGDKNIAPTKDNGNYVDKPQMEVLSRYID